jgi:hypothetical protein
MNASDAIHWTLDTVATRLGDPKDEIYARLFAQRPDFEELFIMDTDGGVRGSMLSTSLNCVLGVAAGSETPGLLLEAARMIHDGYGLSDGDIDLMFRIIRDVCRDTVGEDWTAELDQHWTTLLDTLSQIGATPD